MMHSHPSALRCARLSRAGISLLESLVALAVTAVLLGTAVPSFEAARERRHLDGVAAQLETDIHHARMLAVVQNRTLRLSLHSSAAGSCYLVHTGTVDDCRCAVGQQPVCTAGAQSLRAEHLAAGERPQVESNVRSVVFDASRGTSTPTGTFRVVGRDARAVHLVVNIMGRVRACTPTPGLSGYPAC